MKCQHFRNDFYTWESFECSRDRSIQCLNWQCGGIKFQSNFKNYRFRLLLQVALPPRLIFSSQLRGSAHKLGCLLDSDAGPVQFLHRSHYTTAVRATVPASFLDQLASPSGLPPEHPKHTQFRTPPLPCPYIFAPSLQLNTLCGESCLWVQLPALGQDCRLDWRFPDIRGFSDLWWICLPEHSQHNTWVLGSDCRNTEDGAAAESSYLCVYRAAQVSKQVEFGMRI